jgi:hypothetical protein
MVEFHKLQMKPEILEETFVHTEAFVNSCQDTFVSSGGLRGEIWNSKNPNGSDFDLIEQGVEAVVIDATSLNRQGDIYLIFKRFTSNVQADIVQISQNGIAYAGLEFDNQLALRRQGVKTVNPEKVCCLVNLALRLCTSYEITNVVERYRVQRALAKMGLKDYEAENPNILLNLDYDRLRRDTWQGLKADVETPAFRLPFDYIAAINKVK